MDLTQKEFLTLKQKNKEINRLGMMNNSSYDGGKITEQDEELIENY